MAREFDPDLLRTLVAIAETGGFARAGERVHRTQSTVSQQMKRLEAQAGRKLFRAEGRRMVLTEEGRCLLGYARRILRLHDEARMAFEGPGISGTVRFGTIQDLVEELLPDVVGSFARAHPGVRLEVRVDNTANLVRDLDAGQLDLAVVAGGDGIAGQVLRREPAAWIGSDDSEWARDRPLALVLCEAPCAFREMAFAVLDRARIPWHVVFTSPSLEGVKVAIKEGLGVTPRRKGLAGDGLVVVDETFGLPALPDIELVLAAGSATPSPAVDKLAKGLIGAMA